VHFPFAGSNSTAYIPVREWKYSINRIEMPREWNYTSGR